MSFTPSTVCGHWVDDHEHDAVDRACSLCVKLGDRSLVWLLGALRDAETDEERQEYMRRFRAARGRSRLRNRTGA